MSERDGVWATTFHRLQVAAAGLSICLAACTGSNERDPVEKREALTSDQIAILGFERPTTDWSSWSATIGESTTVTQGSKALSAGTSWSGSHEITSVSLSSLGDVKNSMSVDVRVPAQAGWGEVRAILIAPSLQMWWQDLGGKSLSTLPVGQFGTLSFALPPQVEAALEGTYSDLKIKLVINGPALGAPYLLDNIDIAATSAPPPPPPPPPPPSNPTELQFSLAVPQGESRQSTFLSASDNLQVDSRVEIGVSGSLTNIAGLGPNGVLVQAAAVNAHTNIYGVGDVWLGSQAVVDGFIRSEGTITKQDGSVKVFGARQPGVDVPITTFAWKATPPATKTHLDIVPPNGQLTLAPGAYGDLNQHGGQVHLRTGTYYFDSFNTEPPAQVVVDNARGPIVLYVKNSFVYKGPFGSQAREGQVLVGYLGTSTAFLQAPFVGTMVAPNGKIELQRPTSGIHKGSFFGKHIQVFSDAHILHLPFDWSTLPGSGPPDTDGDGTDDLNDPCVLNADKTDPLVCGCNESEVDSDGDWIPNCIEPACKDDPNNSTFGACGCLGAPNLQPEGKRCIVEACSGSRQEATCDGQGQCGVPDCAPSPEGCVFKIFRDSGYWICDVPIGWEQAEDLCNQEPGRSLVKVDDRLENVWLSNVLGTGAWLGGNDLVQEERWTWSRNDTRSGTLFWLNGLPVRRFVNWEAGEPADGHCLQLGDDGSWSGEDCLAAKAFVCEQPVLNLTPTLDPVCPCDFFPGISCDGCGDDDDGPSGPCVQEDVEFPFTGSDQEKFDAVQAATEACTLNCPTTPTTPEEEAACAASCTGFASVAPLGSLCDEFSDEERAFCDITNVVAGVTCSVADPTCPNGTVCGRIHECAALDDNHQPIPCGDDCPTGICGTQVQVCIDPAKTSECDDIVGTGDDARCVGMCFGSFACGTPDPACAGVGPDSLIGRCTLTEICPDPGTVDPDTDPLNDPNSNLDEEEFSPDDLFPTPESEPLPYPSAKPPGCGGDNEPNCNYDVGEHPWCNYEVDPTEAPSSRTVSDADAPFGDKKGASGSDGPIQFNFDPNLNISYNISELLPLGEAKFDARAEASATADAQFNLFGIKGAVSILDAVGSVEIDRCGLLADAHLKLFGYDFLPTMLGDDLQQTLDDVNTTEEAREDCEQSLADFQVAINRAQKGLRDAQELIRQQKELLANGERLSPDLCEQLLGDGVPADFPSADAPFEGCGSLTPEETINLFIRYYKEQVYALVLAQATLMEEGTPDFPTLQIPFLDHVDTVDEIDESRRETQRIANINFAIGPVPMNLTVEAFVQYGIAGTLGFSLTPDRLLTAYQYDTQEELAAVDASVTPFAGAGVSMFVGVGVDWGAFTAKFGISGDVSLGLLSLPMYAGAGIGVQPEIDERPFPADLINVVASGEPLFPPGPPKKFRFDGFYRFGASMDLEDVLSGEIAAKLRIKFAFFSKTWRKTITKFSSPLEPIHLKLITGEGGAELADDYGILGAVRMPVPFVDLAELETPPPLPPLPDPDPGSGGTGGTGTGGNGGGGAGGNGGSAGNGGPPVSLLVQGDPRYKDFDEGRVDSLFYDGYCECSGSGDECGSTLECCGNNFCVTDDQTDGGLCLSCVQNTTIDLDDFPLLFPQGQHCESTDQCCDNDAVCFPFVSDTGPAYCQPCRERNQPAFDVNGNGEADFGECCDGMPVFHPPSNDPLGGVPVCRECSDNGETCNVDEDCCRFQASPGAFCQDNFCISIVN